MDTNTLQILLDQDFPRTADVLSRRLATGNYSACLAEIHLFEGREKRETLRAELAACGIRAAVRSAYKPLVHFFLEELDCSGATMAQIEYPRHSLTAENRFLLEAYPLTELFPDVDIRFQQATETTSRSHYRVLLFRADRTEEHRVFAPNVVQPDFLGSPVYTPSAWLTVAAAERTSLSPLIDEPVAAEYRQAYDAVMKAVGEHDWGRIEPYFDRLVIDMHLPGVERRLPYGHEHVSTTEAMHEEMYFSLLEFFQHYSGRPRGDRGLQPGQIVPDIRLDNEGTPRVRVTIRANAVSSRDVAANDAFPSRGLDAPGPAHAVDTVDPMLVDLSSVEHPLDLDEIEAALSGIPGRPFAFRSRQGRAVRGVTHEGSLPAVVITGAQHANETSGVLGALRAAQQLKERSNAHFVVIPVENPDGYAMHRALCVDNPGHMHHAARYTALGDDLEYREGAPWFEREARDHAFETSGAQLHLNLHGYPAHEWTRPCTGYLPRGFELWSIPKGFFLILRHQPEYEEMAERLLEHVSLALSRNPRLAAFNEQQLRVYRRYVTELPFRVRNGIPCLLTPKATRAPGLAAGPGITLITEFPDETIYGDAFAFAHSVQAETVVCAAEWWWNRSSSPTTGNQDTETGSRGAG
ncbi:MAG: M14 family zinc carboxypeptidase [Gammaproteobacteria bacterium]